MAPPKKPQDRLAKAIDREPDILDIVTTEPEPIEQVPAFRIDGVLYSMPAKVSAHTALNLLDRIRTEGREAGMAWALREMLGAKAYGALLKCRSLTSDQLNQIMEMAEKLALGALEDTGN